MKKEECRICGKIFKEKELFIIEYDIPKRFENGFKVSCPKCKKEWFQNEIKKNELPCHECGYKGTFETEPYKQYHEIGDGCNCYICEECKKQVAKSFRC